MNRSTVFISYSHQDEAASNFLYYILKRDGVEVYRDREFQLGTAFTDEIREKVKDCDFFIVLLSAESQKSPWVNQEIGLALSYGKTLIPLVLEEGVKEIGLIASEVKLHLYESDPTHLNKLLKYTRRESTKPI